MDEGMWKELETGFETAAEKLPAALAAEGFGVVTQIDLQQTFKDKLGRAVPRYRIFGACNPALAFEAVKTDPRIGVRLPCNVVLYEREGGGVVLGAIDPLASFGEQAPAFRALAEQVRQRLSRVVESFV